MNYINVIGSTKKKRALAESAVIFCISELMPRMRTLDIELTFKNIKNQQFVGWCHEGDGNRDFYIDVEKTLDDEEMVELEKITKNITDSLSILIDKKLDLFSSTVNNK